VQLEKVDIPKVNKATLGKENDVAARGHSVAINLGLDVDDLLRVLLKPRDVDLNIEVTNAARIMSVLIIIDKAQ
jgi:hypothetical protein